MEIGALALRKQSRFFAGIVKQFTNSCFFFYLVVVRPYDEWLYGRSPGDDAGEVEGGALAEEHLLRAQDAGRRICREEKWREK